MLTAGATGFVDGLYTITSNRNYYLSLKKSLVGETPDQGEKIQEDFSARNMLITANSTGR